MPLGLGRRRRAGARWFFATDIHGSDRCFRKFLAAANSYEADVLVLGGDIAGKALVPLVEQPDGTVRYRFDGATHETRGADIDAMSTTLKAAGYYPRYCKQAEIEQMQEDARYREEVFEAEILQQVEEWCRLAEARLSPNVRCIITPGNDDPYAIDAVLQSAARIECPEGKLLELGPTKLASLGNTNRTPWHTPREYDEPELAVQIEQLLEGTNGSGTPLALNFHCPPFRSGLDVTAKLDADLKPIVKAGHVVEEPVGSTAVRAALERYQPTVALHGHIHESAGVWRHGPTVCINPGSEYSSGVLKGALVQFDEGGFYLDHLLTAG